MFLLAPESLVIEQQAWAPRLESWPSIESGDTPLNVGPSEVLPPSERTSSFLTFQWNSWVVNDLGKVDAAE